MVLFRVESVRSSMRVSSPRSFWSCKVFHQLFFTSHNRFPESPSYKSGWAQKDFVAGCDIDTLQDVSVRLVMFCVKMASNVFL